MRKILMLASVAALLIGTAAYAQPDSCLFFDIRDNTSANQLINTPVFPYNVGGANGGMAGDGQTLYISPDYSDAWETQYGLGFPNNDGDGDNKTGKLWLYMDVYDDDSTGTGVISSIGLDIPVTLAGPGPAKNTIGGLGFAWSTTYFPNAGNSGSSVGAVSPAGVTNAKAVKVPVSGSPPGFDTTGGLVPPGTTPPPGTDSLRYQVATLSVTGGARVGGFGAGYEANSTYNLKMQVGTLLITRAFSGAPSDAQERVAFGYAGGVPEGAPGYTDGNSAGASSTLPDAVVVVNAKGDFQQDGRCTVLDNSLFVAARNAGTAGATQRQVFMGDTNGDRRVTVLDNSGFTANRNRPAP